MKPKANFHTGTETETYRDQLMRLARALAAGKVSALIDDLDAGSQPAHVKAFTDANREKRYAKLQQQVEFVSAAFERLDELLEAYVRSVAAAPCDTPSGDADRFLEWLASTQQPSAAQCDYIACQLARHEVEDIARSNRLAHVRFQELFSQAASLAGELETNRSLQVCLNPILAWTVLETGELLDEDAGYPATVVFFPAEGEIRAVALEGDGLERVRELVAFGPVTLDEWQELLDPFVDRDQIPRDALIALCRDLVKVGLVAFA